MKGSETTSCCIHARTVTSPSGHALQVMEVDCPNRPQGVPLLDCLVCRGFERLGHGKGRTRSVECVPENAPAPLPHARAPSTQDTVSRVARPCPVLEARVPAERVEVACQAAHAAELLVVDDLGQILGVVGPEDVARARLQQKLDPDPDEDVVPLTDLTAADLARPLLVQVEPDTPLPEVSSLMSRTAQTRVVVVAQGRPVGEVLLKDVESWLKSLTTAWPLSSLT